MAAARPGSTSVTSESGSSLGRLRRLLLLSALACLAVAVVALPAGPAAIGAMIAGLPAASWAAALAAAVLAFFLRFLRWHFLVRRTAGAVPAGPSALIFAAGLAMALTPGKLGETLKAVELARRFDVPLARGMPIVAVELVTDMVAMSLLTTALFGFVYPQARWIALGGLCFAALLVALLTSRVAAGALARRLGRRRRAQAFAARLAETPELIQSAVGWRGIALASLLAMLAHGAKGLAVIAIVGGCGVVLPWHEAVFAYVAPTLAGALVMLPSSLGAAELGMAALIGDLADPAPSLAIAAAASLMIRLIALWLPLSVGAIALVALRARPLPTRTATA